MAKNKKDDIQCLRDAQEELLTAFVEYKKKEKAKKSHKQYRQIVNALAVLENDPKSNNMVRNFWSLIPKLLSAGKKEEDRLKKLLEVLEKANGDYKKWGESKKSYKTYINGFISYLRTLDNKNNPLKKFSLKINPADEAALKNEEGQIYLRTTLLTKFKSRLRCQDRTSGDKIWLPLRFIAKLYSIEKKTGKEINNRFSEWLNNLAEGIFVHYVKDDCINSINFGAENVSLKFDVHKDINGCETDTFDVKVRIVDDDGNMKDYTAYTPTGKGNIKVPLIVKKISEIDIDHVKSIDQTLREKEKNFKVLKKVSDFYKKLQEQEDYDENKAAKQLYDDLTKINNELDGLFEDLELIRNDGVLRLMDSQYNSQKSNGETFQDIIQIENEYWGILEQDHDILNDDDEKCVYYQVLTNSTSQNEFRVTKKILPIKGTSVKNNLMDIINYI